MGGEAMFRKVFLCVASLLIGCAGENGGFQVQSAPRVQLVESGRAIQNGGNVLVSVLDETTFTLSNVGDAPLKVYGTTVTDNFLLATDVILSRSNPLVLEAGGSSWTFNVQALRGGEEGRLTLSTNQTLDGTNKFDVLLKSESSSAKLVLQPALVDFGVVQSGTTGIKPVSLLNVGSAQLSISKIIFSGRSDFWIELGGETFEISSESASPGLSLTPPILIEPGSAKTMNVFYKASYPDEARAHLVLESNGASTSMTALEMVANAEGPCLKVTPARVDFGGKHVGQAARQDVRIESCNTKSLEVFGLSVIDDSSGEFSVDTSLFSLPFSLGGGSSVNIPVTYVPSSVSRQGPGGIYVTDTAKLRIETDSFVPEYDVELSGFGTDGACPVPAITVAEGDEVIPQTRLTLSARNSTTTTGNITRWEWSVVQPQGSASVFLPTTTRQDVSFEANIVGEYIFRLKVWNSLGVESCSSAEQIVNVVSDSAIRVELLWSTPRDANQFDTGSSLSGQSVGSDLDLHFLRPGAAWDYFGNLDCHWQNPNPDWGTRGAMHDPSLDRDDTDGAGPENLNMNSPENIEYRVGVHYWDDWGFGPSWVTIRVYVFGQLREQWNDVILQTFDLWDALLIEWPSQRITRIGDGINPDVYPGIF